MVYSGYKLLTPGYGAFDPQVIRHNGEDMLVFTQFAGPRGGGPAYHGSYSEIFNQSYSSQTQVRPVGTISGQSLTHDLHEFNVVGEEGETALITSYITVQRNITFVHCPGQPSVQWLKDGAFSEMSTDGSNANLFQRAFLDLVDPADTYVCPGDHLVGSGTGPGDTFDYLHINSIDKDIYGDYLVSCRHMNAVYKIAGNTNPEGHAPGTIVWTLGGRKTDFPVMDSEVPTSPNLNFSFQHHARWAPEIEGITLWDNANNAVIDATANSSSGMDIRLGNGTATLVGQWISPGGELDSSQGSYQQLDNGGHFLGLGSFPAIYELTADGQTAFYAKFGPLPLQSYRSFKFNWTGLPDESEIGFFAFSQTCNNSRAAYYSSWNGATEVAAWKYYTSGDNETFREVAEKAYGGTFETMATAPFNLYAYAEAYDKNGTKMGRSKVAKTWVPPADLELLCNNAACPPGTDYTQNSTACAAPPDSLAYGNFTDTAIQDIAPPPIAEDPEQATNDTPADITSAIDQQPPQDNYIIRRPRRNAPADPKGQPAKRNAEPESEATADVQVEPPRLHFSPPRGIRKSLPKRERMIG